MKKRPRERCSEEDDSSSQQVMELRTFPRPRSVGLGSNSVRGLALCFPSEDVFHSRVEPLIRNVVSAAIEERVSSFLKSWTRKSPSLLCGEAGRQLQLQFWSKLPITLYSGNRIVAHDDSPVQVVLVDTLSNEIVKNDPLSSIKIQVVVVDGDFCRDGKEDWSEEEFNKHVVCARDGKPDLLKGDLVVKLSNGIGQLGDLSFTDNSSWTRSKRLKLGARTLDNSCKIREAITGAFSVKDHRGELYKKHHPPSLDDEVWRLENIAKDGVFHKRLNENGIRTVKDFRCRMFKDEASLHRILKMAKKPWKETIQHARECCPDEENVEEPVRRSWIGHYGLNSALLYVGHGALDIDEGPITELQQEPIQSVEVHNMQNCYSGELPFSSSNMPCPVIAEVTVDNVSLSHTKCPEPVSKLQQESSHSIEIPSMQYSVEQFYLLDESLPGTLHDAPCSTVSDLSISDYDICDPMLVNGVAGNFPWYLHDTCQIPQYVSQASSFPSSWARLLIAINFGKKLLAAKEKRQFPCRAVRCAPAVSECLV